MTTSTEVNELLDTLAKILLRCFVFGFLLLLLWFGACLLTGTLFYELQSRLFDLTRHELRLIHFCGIA